MRPKPNSLMPIPPQGGSGARPKPSNVPVNTKAYFNGQMVILAKLRKIAENQKDFVWLALIDEMMQTVVSQSSATKEDGK